MGGKKMNPPKMILGWTNGSYSQYLCPFCPGEGTSLGDECDECEGTDRDSMPWSELFKSGREQDNV